MVERPLSRRGDAVDVADPSIVKVVAEQELATGPPDWRWTERVAAFTPVPASDSVQVTLTLVEACVAAPAAGMLKLTVGAVLSMRTVPEVAWVAAFPALSEMFASQR